jgi:hypothetical protein
MALWRVLLTIHYSAWMHRHPEIIDCEINGFIETAEGCLREVISTSSKKGDVSSTKRGWTRLALYDVLLSLQHLVMARRMRISSNRKLNIDQFDIVTKTKPDLLRYAYYQSFQETSALDQCNVRLCRSLSCIADMLQPSVLQPLYLLE